MPETIKLEEAMEQKHDLSKIKVEMKSGPVNPEAKGPQPDKVIIKLHPIQRPEYKIIETRKDGYAYRSLNGMFIIQSIAIEDDLKPWIHVSFSRKSRMPDYKDITRIKADFIGADRKAIMVFPEAKLHVNLHPYCLHLFCCLAADPLPEFSKGGTL